MSRMVEPSGNLPPAAGTVAATYRDWAGRQVRVDPEVLAAVRRHLGPPPAPLVVPVEPLPPPPRCWGWMVQLYAAYSAGSWGIGDLADLRELAVRSAHQLGADLVLVNPLHAVAPVLPITASPYSPTSRRYVSPLYLRIEELRQYADAPADVRARVDALRLPPPDPGALLDRDAVWRTKSAALQLLWPFAGPVELDDELRDFATFCALAERHGLPWQHWPAGLHSPRSPSVAAAAQELADRVAFFGWLQHCCDAQLAGAQHAALDAGMRVGIVHDLAVGVDPGGADAWALADVLAGQVSVGAPPDSFNQQGQDWALPPWRPDALAASDFRAYRAMLTASFARGGGLRIDHVMGLSRLWWIPPGHSPDQGAYVSYDEAAMLGLLVQAAAGKLVVGEDLGTVEPRMRQELARLGILGSSVLWFERLDDDPAGVPKPPTAWREAAMASLSTHDLPTAPGLLAGEQVRVRAELGQLGRPVAEEQAAADAELAALLSALEQAGALAAGEREPEAVILAMHRYLAATPSRVLLASPYDVLGEVRQPNLPGTSQEYPNWRLPLPAALEDWLGDPRVAATARVLRREEG